MSTYYYLVCRDCKEYTFAARVGGTVGFAGDADKAVPQFMVAHCGCNLEVLSEHNIDETDGYLEWEPENAEALYEQATRDAPL